MKLIPEIKALGRIRKDLKLYFENERWWDPKVMSQQLEVVSPWLANQVLNYASGWIAPFALGMGLRLLRLEDEVVEVELPLRWKNWGEPNEMSPAAILAAGEYAVRIFWQRHLDEKLQKLRLKEYQFEVYAPLNEDLTLKSQLAAQERESVLFQSRLHGLGEFEQAIQIFNNKKQLIGQMISRCTLETEKTLPPRNKELA